MPNAKLTGTRGPSDILLSVGTSVFSLLGMSLLILEEDLRFSEGLPVFDTKLSRAWRNPRL